MSRKLHGKQFKDLNQATPIWEVGTPSNVLTTTQKAPPTVSIYEYNKTRGGQQQKMIRPTIGHPEPLTMK